MNNLIDLIQEYELKNQLKEVTDAYKKIGKQPFSIGVMGKAGAGKSSFINTLCQQYLCETGGAEAVTRDVLKIPAKLGNMDLFIYDFPGIAESEQWNNTYIELYKRYLEKLDFIFWTIRLDDRALKEDENFFERQSDSMKDKAIFLLSQADNANPNWEWNHSSFQPSLSQKDTIFRKKYLVISEFWWAEHLNVIPVATSYANGCFRSYNFDEIFEKILFKLNTINEVSNELSLQTSWAITSREMKKGVEFMKASNPIIKEQAEELQRDLNETIKELEKLKEDEEDKKKNSEMRASVESFWGRLFG